MSKAIQFIKMQSLGNDFLVIDSQLHPQVMGWEPASFQKLADRRLGIGFDQMLLLTGSEKADIGLRVINADGSAAEQCGNGLRCVGSLWMQQHNAASVSVEMVSGVFEVRQTQAGIKACLGEPEFIALPSDLVGFEVQGYPVPLKQVIMGNPHLVVPVKQLEDAYVQALGKKLSTHQAFSEGINVGFMLVEDAHTIQLRVYERGSGETHACGSGACAAVAIGRQLRQLASPVTVSMPGGELIVHWGESKEGEASSDALWLEGPVEKVFEGVL